MIGQQEGLDLLLKSIDHICTKSRNDIQFVIVGDGPEFPNVRALSKQKDLNEFMTFTGRVEDKTLFTALSTADVCVNPDRFNEMNEIIEQ